MLKCYCPLHSGTVGHLPLNIYLCDFLELMSYPAGYSYFQLKSQFLLFSLSPDSDVALLLAKCGSIKTKMYVHAVRSCVCVFTSLSGDYETGLFRQTIPSWSVMEEGKGA